MACYVAVVHAIELFEDYVNWLRINVPRAYENLAPPATRDNIDKLEQALGQRIPDDVKAVLMMHNGQRLTDVATHDEDGAVPCIPTLSFLSTGLIEECWSSWADMCEDDDIEDLHDGCEAMPGAEGRVRPLYASPGWIPLWSDPVRSDYIGLDLDPDSAGIRGQIINFGRNEGRHFVCADNFTELLQILLDEVRSGRWPSSTVVCDEAGNERSVFGEVEHGVGRPFFGDLEDHFFNPLYNHAMARSGIDVSDG
ncbi:SMI1/KNR4 family protein [Nocardia sp. NPDC058658]|uniref:SMI1/KNR4 family protein n=1 Tax=Nocardia sp. NPDC058658 TaxID=3346580 RepID=UPI003660E0FB